MFDDYVFEERVDLLLLFKQILQFVGIVVANIGKLLIKTR